ncbi:hydrolase, TatD family protein [Metarhizium album ARSEF 1941]|uniref:Hydrolase, TatD family protein n=1 Tax=Metarhizium album (strain ARSEF 1941) TaxID=1081103 RepID=A0A0B2X8P5_METAS|nr:hydrolase, TatD family protein [Metarhizium album ARSEF 1941]KHO01910.1 hydrolase, TatD family protein [Metarhizium album ARSEF 1941]
MAAQAAETPNGNYKPRYVDIGINLSDPIFRGRYHGHQKHPDDLSGVIDRARQVGCTKLMVTGSDIENSREALKLALEYRTHDANGRERPAGTCYATVGIHPCSSAIFGVADLRKKQSEHTTPCEDDPYAPMSEEHQPDTARSAHAIEQLTTAVAQARSSSRPHMVAMGEFGLDYDRLNYCNRVIQKHSFAAQLRVAASLQPQLPLFLHSRAAHGDFVAILKSVFGERLEHLDKGGVVHSFTGTMEEMTELMELGLYIGINGCSFKTEENCQVVKAVRLDRLMIETDGPWCEVRPSHQGYKYLVEESAEHFPVQNGTVVPEPGTKQPGRQKNEKKRSQLPDRFKVVKKEKWEEGAMVKGRNEPCTIERVAQIIAAIKGVRVEDVCEAAWKNTVHVFGLEETI